MIELMDRYPLRLQKGQKSPIRAAHGGDDIDHGNAGQVFEGQHARRGVGGIEAWIVLERVAGGVLPQHVEVGEALARSRVFAHGAAS